MYFHLPYQITFVFLSEVRKGYVSADQKIEILKVSSDRHSVPL